MGAGYTCMKYLFIVLNIIFLLFAVAGIAISIWMFVDPTIPLHFTQESKDYLISTIILLLASIILLILSILGIYSVSREVRKSLVLSFCLLLIIVVAEIAAGVWGYINRDSLESHIRASVKSTVREDYDKDENIRNLFDTIQMKMHCCGAELPTDWSRGKEFNMVISGNPNKYNIPESCCKTGLEPQKCTKATQGVEIGADLDKNVIYENGCYTLILNKLKDSVCIIMIVGGVILAVQILGLLLGLILACSMNRSHRYKG
ncbi:CD151 antigen isoform X1 [Leptinotarsa decemlineata]|uniref:CD151 antigen isoform X1 n=2 Tax=Leptinotarsa decemlineata TaxID=7539 RepID=UPI003D30BE2A